MKRNLILILFFTLFSHTPLTAQTTSEVGATAMVWDAPTALI